MNKVSFLLVLFPVFLSAQNTPDYMLSKSINYHDPNGQWPTVQATFHYTETRPSGPDRKTIFELDNRRAEWTIDRDDLEIYVVNGETVNVVKGDKGQDRGRLLRNYYLYLWGLPMKLKDEGTPAITQSEDEEVNGVPVDVLRVPYEKETYYFSFSTTN